MASSHTLDRLDIVFDDTHAIANAGLLLPATLAERLGIEQAADQLIDLGERAGAHRPGRKLLTLVHSMLAGGDCTRRRRPAALRRDRRGARPPGHGALHAGDVRSRIARMASRASVYRSPFAFARARAAQVRALASCVVAGSRRRLPARHPPPRRDLTRVFHGDPWSYPEAELREEHDEEMHGDPAAGHPPLAVPRAPTPRPTASICPGPPRSQRSVDAKEHRSVLLAGWLRSSACLCCE